MSWPVDGESGWESFGVPIESDPQQWELPEPAHGWYYDPVRLNGLGPVLEARVHVFNGGTVVVRARSTSLEAEFFAPYLWSDGLLDQFAFELSEPCALILDIFDDDRETVRWSVGTSPFHSNPFLVYPDRYAEQEVDVAAGAATVGTVTVGIIDPSRSAGDQDSGWVTYRLAEQGLADIRGRRARLSRFISEALGYQVLADGPAGSPRLDTSYASYGFEIRDTRETERKVRIFDGGGGIVPTAPGGAFDPTGVKTILPDAVWGGYGYDVGTDTYLVDPAEPLLGQVSSPGLSGFTGGLDIFGIRVVDLTATPGNAIALRKLGQSSADAGIGVLTRVGAPFESGALMYQDYTVAFPKLHLYWRLQGDTDWEEISGADLQLSGRSQYDSIGSIPFAVTNILEHQAYPNEATETHREVTEIRFGHREFLPIVNEDVLPAIGADIEIIVVYRGPPSEDLPVYIEGITAGELARNTYAGLYSPRDIDGFVVPTGIRYNVADLLQMTDLVRLRLFEVPKDARDWLEKSIYAPTGWAPALNQLGEISPVSQVAPTSSFGLPAITNAITEPSSDWNAGERIINVISFTYPRDYRPGNPENAETGDGLAAREITVEWVDAVSVDRNGREVLEIKGDAFRAIGDSSGEPISGDLQAELAWQLSELRQIHVQNRYSLGAPAISVAVMREAIPQLRAGSWVVLDLSWLPDYATARRGLISLAQIVAISDLDCAWRRILVEVVVPIVDPYGES